MMSDARGKFIARSRAAFFITAAVAVGLLSLGVFRKEFAQVFRNAVLICLSCIGIG